MTPTPTTPFKKKKKKHKKKTKNTGASQIAGVFNCYFYYITICLIEIPVFNANSVDPDYTPRSVAFDLGLHRLSFTHFGVSRLKSVK